MENYIVINGKKAELTEEQLKTLGIEVEKKVFNIKDYKGKYAMHCNTEEKANEFLKYLDSLGLKWTNGKRYINCNNYNGYDEKTCYFFNEGVYSDFEYYKKNGYAILEFDDFIFEVKEEYKSPYDRVENESNGYFYIGDTGNIWMGTGSNSISDNTRFEVKNYYNNKQFAEQKALRMKLTNMLEDFSYKNGWKDEYRYDEEFQKYYFRFDYKDEVFVTKSIYIWLSLNEVYFASPEIAEQAIEEIIKPFMAENPQFKW